ncbi:Amino oxidase domain-containing protein [Citrus sinensis]|nr:Amino oxidase domain-containing protein [Citrus sinensis]
MWRRSFSNGVSLTRTLKGKKWDALVIGGGHNGLIAAAYLARGGLSVAVLERRHVIGGAAVTEELIPGFKFSRCSYLQSLLRPSSDVLKATVAADAITGSMASIHAPGSGYVLLHHVMGETDGDRNLWSHVEGGMGSVSLAISKAATKAGAHILVNTEVSQIMIGDSGEVDGVLLVDGTRVHSSFVLSNATPYKTFMVRSVLLGLVPRDVLPDDFLRAIKYSDYHSGVTKINVAVDKLPQFHCFKSSQLEVGPHHTATVHIGCERPVMEMTIPSSLDKTISPPGKHVVSLFTQYTPYKPSDGSWEDPTYRESYGQKCFSLIDEYAPGFSSSVIGYDLLTPPDLEREFGLTGGNIFHGAMGLDSLFLMRPVKGWSGYRTPVRGLYLCGSGSHPGGGVMGAPGRNAAHVVLQDFKKQSR